MEKGFPFLPLVLGASSARRERLPRERAVGWRSCRRGDPPSSPSGAGRRSPRDTRRVAFPSATWSAALRRWAPRFCSDQLRPGQDGGRCPPRPPVCQASPAQETQAGGRRRGPHFDGVSLATPLRGQVPVCGGAGQAGDPCRGVCCNARPWAERWTHIFTIFPRLLSV